MNITNKDSSQGITVLDVVSAASSLIPVVGNTVGKLFEMGKDLIGTFAQAKKRKEAGETVSNYQAIQDAALAEMERLANWSEDWNKEFSQYLGSFTDADKVFSTMRKIAKMRKEDLYSSYVVDGDTLSYGGLSLNPSKLNVYNLESRQVNTGGTVGTVGTGGTGGTVGTGGIGVTSTQIEGGYIVAPKKQQINLFDLIASIGVLLFGFMYHTYKPVPNRRRAAAARARAAKAAKRTTTRKTA